MIEHERATAQELVESARRLAAAPGQTFLGVAGAPGSGKSTIAELLITALAPDAVLVSMDGFHLAGVELRRLNRLDRKGAPDTFDAGGFVALLRRLRARDETVAYAPYFDRSLEESIGSGVPVSRDIPLVVVEGNYLLYDEPPWDAVRDLLDECWYLDPGEEARLAWLVARHQRYGRDLDEATGRSYGSDQRNAELIMETRHLATRIITVVDRAD
jgi:pantothenate kinase